MKRWEHFNKLLGTNDSLQKQMNGMIVERIKGDPETDIGSYMVDIAYWLTQEVKED